MKQLLLPSGTTAGAARLVTARALRGFADGFVSVLLVGYLVGLGYTDIQVSAIVTGTLLGSAALTLVAGLAGFRLPRRTVLLWACGLMAATGIGFFSIEAFWPLLVVAVVGTLNPSAGDVSVFLPTEQALLTDTVEARGRTALFAHYNLAGAFAGALGALASGLPALLARREGWDLTAAQRGGFLLYAVVGACIWLLYRGLPRPVHDQVARERTGPLTKSRGIVLRLAALFSLDSAGGGLVVQSMLVLWLYRRFGLSQEAVGSAFFVIGLLNSFSQLAASRLAARIGLINTMVYTHLPSNVLLVLAAFMPSAPLALLLIFLRSALSQMDVPARQAYVMSVVPPAERAAAASVTNVPRSLAAATTPLLGGWLLSLSAFGWPLLLAGLSKGIYDVLLWRMGDRGQGREPRLPSEAAGRPSNPGTTVR